MSPKKHTEADKQRIASELVTAALAWQLRALKAEAELASVHTLYEALAKTDCETRTQNNQLRARAGRAVELLGEIDTEHQYKDGRTLHYVMGSELDEIHAALTEAVKGDPS